MTDEQVKTLIGIARAAAFNEIRQVMGDVLEVVTIDDRTTRLTAAAAIMTRFGELE